VYLKKQKQVEKEVRKEEERERQRRQRADVIRIIFNTRPRKKERK